MNGRSPTMCVTVLQSQPSVSIPTLTMQRTSRPGGCSGRLELRAPAPRSLPGRWAGPARSRGQSRLADRVEREPHPARSRRSWRRSTSVSCDHLGVDADRVDCCPSRLRNAVERRRRDAGRRLALRQPLVDDLRELRVLADEDEHRRPLVVAVRLPRLAQLLPQRRRAVAIGVRGLLEHRLRLRVRPSCRRAPPAVSLRP